MISALTRLVGWGFFPLALLAKLPFAMSVVAVMTSVSVVSGSYGRAGMSAALVGVGTMLSGPVYGMFADRFGQRPVLLFTAIGNAGTLLGLGFVLRDPQTLQNPALIYIVAFLIGATQPQASSMVRTRWLQALRATYADSTPTKITNAVLSYESMTDELVFVLGPVLVGAVAATMGVVFPLDMAAVLTLIGVVGFALHPSARFSRGHVSSPVTAGSATTPTPVAPVRALVALRVLIPVFGMVSIGLFFGATLTSLAGYMETLGRADSTGLFYGIMGVTSALCAFAVVALPDAITLVARWLAAAALAFSGTIVLLISQHLGGVIGALLIMGAGIGPALVTLYSIAAKLAPPGRTTALMAMMSTGVTVGQSAASAFTGVAIDALGYQQGYVFTAGATLALLVLAVIQLGLSRKLGQT